MQQLGKRAGKNLSHMGKGVGKNKGKKRQLPLRDQRRPGQVLPCPFANTILSTLDANINKPRTDIWYEKIRDVAACTFTVFTKNVGCHAALRDAWCGRQSGSGRRALVVHH